MRLKNICMKIHVVYLHAEATACSTFALFSCEGADLQIHALFQTI